MIFFVLKFGEDEKDRIILVKSGVVGGVIIINFIIYFSDILFNNFIDIFSGIFFIILSDISIDIFSDISIDSFIDIFCFFF